MNRFLLILCAVGTSAFAEWTQLEDCKLVRSESNDGDSFLIQCPAGYRGETEHRVRLYFVDTAETSANSDFMRKRLSAQAAYWGQSDFDIALKMGLRARQTVQKLLSRGFDVYTQGDYAPSLGRPRLYVMVRVKERWLSEILAEEGLVRIHGDGAKLPDGPTAKNFRARLKRLERVAKSSGRNGWRGNAAVEPDPEENPFQPYDTQTLRSTWIYSVDDGRKVTVVEENTKVTVVAPSVDGRSRIRFEQNGSVYEGLCAENSLK